MDRLHGFCESPLQSHRSSTFGGSLGTGVVQQERAVAFPIPLRQMLYSKAVEQCPHRARVETAPETVIV
jgi:hypothetical protein